MSATREARGLREIAWSLLKEYEASLEVRSLSYPDPIPSEGSDAIVVGSMVDELDAIDFVGSRTPQEATIRDGEDGSRDRSRLHLGIQGLRQRLLRLLALFRWSQVAPGVDTCTRAVDEAFLWESACQQAADNLFGIHQQLLLQGTPSLPVDIASSVLYEGRCLLMPRGVHRTSASEGSEGTSGSTSSSVTNELSYRIGKELTRSFLPADAKVVDVERGMAKLQVLGRFRVDLTLYATERDGKGLRWHVKQIQHVPLPRTHALDRSMLDVLSFEIERRMIGSAQPLVHMVRILGDLNSTLVSQQVKSLAQRIKHSKLSEHIHTSVQGIKEEGGEEHVMFRLWTQQNDKRRQLLLRGSSDGRVTGKLELHTSGMEGEPLVIAIPEEVHTPIGALSWALDRCVDDLLDALHDRLARLTALDLTMGSAMHKDNGHPVPSLLPQTRWQSLRFEFARNHAIHVGVERSTGQLTMTGVGKLATFLDGPFLRTLEQHRSGGQGSERAQAALQDLMRKYYLETLSLACLMHGLQRVDATAPPYSREIRTEESSPVTSACFVLPDWGQEKLDMHLQLTVFHKERDLYAEWNAFSHCHGISTTGKCEKVWGMVQPMCLSTKDTFAPGRKRKGNEGFKGMDFLPHVNDTRKVVEEALHVAHVYLEKASGLRAHCSCSTDTPSKLLAQGAKESAANLESNEGALWRTLPLVTPRTAIREILVSFRCPESMAFTSEIFLHHFSRSLLWCEKNNGSLRFYFKQEAQEIPRFFEQDVTQFCCLAFWREVQLQCSKSTPAWNALKKFEEFYSTLSRRCGSQREHQGYSTRSKPGLCLSPYPDEILSMPCLEILLLEGKIDAFLKAVQCTEPVFGTIKQFLTSSAGLALQRLIVILPKSCHRLQIFVHPLLALDMVVLERDNIWVSCKRLCEGKPVELAYGPQPPLAHILQGFSTQASLKRATLTLNSKECRGYLVNREQLSALLQHSLPLIFGNL